MPTVQPFGESMIKSFLDRNELDYFDKSGLPEEIDLWGDFFLHQDDDGQRGCNLTFALSAEGENDSIYGVKVISDKEIPRSGWGQALLLCNSWNKERLWPKAFLNADTESATSTSGSIWLEAYILLTSGVHQELVDDFSSLIIRGGLAFWEWAHKEKGF